MTTTTTPQKPAYVVHENERARSYRVQLENLARRAWADGVVLSIDRRMDGPPCAANQQMVVDAWPARNGPFSAKRPVSA